MGEILPKVSTKVKVADKISFLKFRNSEKAKKLKKISQFRACVSTIARGAQDILDFRLLKHNRILTVYSDNWLFMVFNLCEYKA